MSRRTDQIASTLQRAAQEVLSRGLQDPRIRGIITVTRIVVSEDLKSATLYVSVLPKDKQELTVHGLSAAGAHIRRRIGDLVALKQMPKLLFKIDQQVQAHAKVYEALGQVRAERDESPAGEVDEPAEPSGEKEGGQP